MLRVHSMTPYGDENSLRFSQAQASVNRIKNEISLSEMTPDVENRLFHTLEAAQKSLKRTSCKMEAFASSFFCNQVHELNQEIVSLYGKIHAMRMDRDVQHLKATIEAARALITGGNKEALRKHLSQLFHEVEQLESIYRVSKENLQIVKLARDTIKEGERVLKGEKRSKVQSLDLRALHHIQELDLEGSMELFEVAACVYNKEMRKALGKFRELPDSHRNLYRNHMRRLGTIQEQPSDSIETLQALIATAHALAQFDDGKDYLSERQIQQLFDGLRDITLEDDSPIR